MGQKKEVSTNKILIYYTLAIVIPCIGLGILAFRGIRNDQALVERENQRRLQDAGEAVTVHLLDQLDSIEQTFRLLEKKEIPLGSSHFNDTTVTGFVQNHPPIKSVLFIHKRTGKMAVPDNQVLYLPDESYSLSYPPLSDRATQAINTGWSYEFRDQNYPAAIRHYAKALTQVKDEAGKAMIYNIMARIHRKRDQNDPAIQCYQQIAENYPDIYLPGGIPAGITARREIIKLYQEQEKTALIQQEVSRLFNMLRKNRIPLKKAYFQNTREETENLLMSWDTFSPLLSNELELVEKTENLTENLLHFQSITGTVENLVQNQMNRTSKSFLKSTDFTYFFAAVNDERGTWILLYDDALCFQELVIPELEVKTEALGFTWRKITADPVYSSGDEHEITYSFADHLPDWKIRFESVKTSSLSSLFLSTRGIYLYIFILILVILVLGLFFTLYTVNQELRLSRMKSFFVSSVSHEFKSPITSIRQMAEMLDRDRVSSPERKKIYYSTMLHESERLSHLVENILDFARMEQGRKHYLMEAGQIEDTIAEAVETFRLQTEGKAVQLTFSAFDDLPSITFDREAMEQVMHNLLDNALKYGGEDKRIAVSLERSGGLILIKVRDWGLGIPKADQDKIFNRFYRVGDELTGKVKGSGIGLTIVRQIIEDHHGKVSVKSKSGEGSTFIISLPVKPLI